MRGDPDEFEDDLRGDCDVSRAYRRITPPAHPPREVDDLLRLKARAALAEPPLDAKLLSTKPLLTEPPRRPRWFAPFALAASVILSVAIVTAIVFEPARPKREEAPRWVNVAANKFDRLPIGEAAGESDPHLVARKVYSTDPPRIKPAHGRDMTQPKDPEVWLARIRELRRSGHPIEADLEYQRFRNAFPNYSSPDAESESR